MDKNKSDLNEIIKRVMNESKEDRIVRGANIKLKHKNLISNGFHPYYLKLKNNYEYEIIKVDNITYNHRDIKFYFLDEDEFKRFEKLLIKTNEIISNHFEAIKLHGQMLISILEQKIIQ